ncbi:MAG: hypothetical protein AAGH90_05725 [Pseudomonadota bacterium]
MSRDVDERKKRKALRKLRKAAALAEQGLGPPLSDWEREFLEEVEARVEKYGSAFHDLEKGAADEPLSALQNLKLKEIDKKARGKGSGFKQRKPLGSKKKPAYTSRTRQIDDDIEETPMPPPKLKAKPQLVKASELKPEATSQPVPQTKAGPPKLRVIKGGAAED